MNDSTDLKQKARQWARRLRELGRQVVSPWQSGDSLLELRRTVVERALAELVPIGQGRKLFPYGTVRIDLRPCSSEQSVRLTPALQPEFQAELRRALVEELATANALNADVTLDLVLHDADEASERPFAVSFDHERPAVSPEVDEASAAAEPQVPRGPRPVEDLPPKPPALHLELVQGSAERSSYSFAAERIYLGRMRDVFDGHGRLRRRNHVAFDDEGEQNSTVSREHAQIRFSQETGEYRLVDDRSAYGTRIFRDGRPIDVSSRDRRGIRLREGDQIYLGKAVLRVTLEGGSEPSRSLAHLA